MEQGKDRTFAGRLRIGAYNIAHGRGIVGSPWRIDTKDALIDRLDNIALLLEAEKLDLVVLNEIDVNSCRTYSINQVRHIAEKARFPFWVEQCSIDLALGPLKHRYGNAVLSRHPISQVNQISFPGHSRWETVLLGKKSGLLCTITLPDEKQVRLMAVHLEHRLESNRLGAARKIEEIRKSSPAPLILAGDFNSTRLEYPHARPDPSGQTAISWLLESGAYKTLPSGPLKDEDLTFLSSRPIAVIDWILVPADWIIVGKRTIASALSDHRPVVMEVEMPGQGSNSH
jgi:endonuclease/exonuclease/phosphatase family metal-dependent hydrolase